VTYENDWLSLSIEGLAYAFRIGRQGDLMKRGLILSMSWEIRGHYLVSCLLKERDNFLPAPPSLPRSMD
jgi:hypothetical protein